MALDEEEENQPEKMAVEKMKKGRAIRKRAKAKKFVVKKGEKKRYMK